MDELGRRYKNPPVVEALGELFFEGSAWDLTIPGSFYERVKERFPKKAQLDLLALEVQVDQSGTRTQTAPGDTRMVLRSEDESRLVQIGRDVLVVNQLRPYPDFETWSPVLLAMLDEYRELAQPARVARLGLRYINRIVLPTSIVMTEEYFKIYPEVPQELGAAHRDFLLRMELIPHHAGHQIVLTFGSAPPETPEHQAFVLDLYDTLTMGTGDAFGAIEERLVEAHENIQWVFENTITDATRAIFGEVGDDRRE